MRVTVLGADREACALAMAVYHDANSVWPYWQCDEVQHAAEEQHCQGLWHHICRFVLTHTLHVVQAAACGHVGTQGACVCAAIIHERVNQLNKMGWAAVLAEAQWLWNGM